MDYFIDIDGVSLHIQLGIRNIRKPYIVFLHDSLGSIELWKDFPEKLGQATGLNTLVYNRQGHATSDAFNNDRRDPQYLEREADVLNQIIEHLELDQVILFGHSDGGSIALIAAAKYPSYIVRIITEAAHVLVEDVTLDGIRNTVNDYHSSDLKDKLAKYHGEKTDALFAAWADTWQADDYRDWNIEGFLAEVRCPALIIQGENDEYGSPAQAERIAGQISGKAEILMLPSVGHTPHKQASDEVLQASARFIKMLPVGKVLKTV